MKSYLEFERDIKVLEEELEKLKDPFTGEGLSEVEINKITQLQREIDNKLKATYANLDAWQITQVARFAERPKSKFIIDSLFSNFINLSGDRRLGEDKALISGFAELEGRSVLVLGQEKGDDLESRVERNFGMLKSSGYKTAVRLMLLADKFNIPCVNLIDTPGASATVQSENSGIHEAIASSINCQMNLKVPVISVILSEGGSGGAVALASANKVLMLENAVYGVISPESASTILYGDPSKSLDTAKAMKLTANELLEMGIIDEIIPEKIPAHRDKEQFLLSIKKALIRNLEEFEKYTREEIFEQRKKRFLDIGKQKTFTVFSKGTSWITKDDFFVPVKEILFKYKKELVIASLLMLVAFLFLF